ncbi:unnamed protein product [Lampetra planeri]
MPPALPSVSVAPPPSSVARTPPVGAASQNHGSSNSHSTQSLALPSALSRVPSSNASTTCSPGTQLPHAGAGRPSVAMQSPVANRNPASRFSGTGTTGVSPNAQVRTSSVPSHTAPRAGTAPVRQSYPAPLPGTPPPPPGLPTEAAAKLPPQRPVLKLGRSDNQNAIVLQWNVAEENPKCAPVESYHLFAYHEDPNSPMPSQWKKIGEVKALPLPMACTLTQFVCRSKYYFAVRAKDVYGRYGPFCEPQCTDFKTP